MTFRTRVRTSAEDDFISMVKLFNHAFESFIALLVHASQNLRKELSRSPRREYEYKKEDKMHLRTFPSLILFSSLEIAALLSRAFHLFFSLTYIVEQGLNVV